MGNCPNCILPTSYSNVLEVSQGASLTFRNVEERVLRNICCMVKVTKLRIQEQCLRTLKQHKLRKVITSNRRTVESTVFHHGLKSK